MSRRAGQAMAMCAALGIPPTDEAKGIGHIYFLFCEGQKAIKIGFSFDVSRRLKALQTASPGMLRLLGTIRGTEQDERALHQKFHNLRLSGEWFKAHKRLRDYIAKVTA